MHGGKSGKLKIIALKLKMTESSSVSRAGFPRVGSWTYAHKCLHETLQDPTVGSLRISWWINLKIKDFFYFICYRKKAGSQLDSKDANTR